jgi:hypothetical protein
MSLDDDNRQFPKKCVVLCVVTMEKVLITVSDKTYDRKNLWNHCEVQGGCWSCFECLQGKSRTE